MEMEEETAQIEEVNRLRIHTLQHLTVAEHRLIEEQLNIRSVFNDSFLRGRFFISSIACSAWFEHRKRDGCEHTDCIKCFSCEHTLYPRSNFCPRCQLCKTCLESVYYHLIMITSNADLIGTRLVLRFIINRDSVNEEEFLADAVIIAVRDFRNLEDRVFVVDYYSAFTGPHIGEVPMQILIEGFVRKYKATPGGLETYM